MRSRARRASRDNGKTKLPRQKAAAEDGPLQPSPTAVAAEAIRTGVLPQPRVRRRDEIPREDDAMRVGDPDDSSLDNEYVGDALPGGDAPTPDQNGVDDIGRAYGLQE